MPKSDPTELHRGLMIHTVEPASERISRWKRDIAAMSEAELVLASALIAVRRAELAKEREASQD